MGGWIPLKCTRVASFTLLVLLEQVCHFVCHFILLLSLFYTDHLVSIILFNYDYLNFTTTLLCLCFYSLYYHFVNLNFTCNNNNLYIRLSTHFTYDTDKEIRDFEIYFSIISNNVILMLLYPHIFKWFFDINKQAKRVLRSDTRPVSCLYDVQVWLRCWSYHYYLLIWRCLSNYVRYLCAYIKSNRSDVLSAKKVETTFAVIYLCLFFSVGLNFSIKYVSYDSFKIFLSSRMRKNSKILKFLLPYVPIWPSTSISSGCWICCL